MRGIHIDADNLNAYVFVEIPSSVYFGVANLAENTDPNSTNSNIGVVAYSQYLGNRLWVGVLGHALSENTLGGMSSYSNNLYVATTADYNP